MLLLPLLLLLLLLAYPLGSGIRRISLLSFQRPHSSLGQDIRVVVGEDVVDCGVVVFAGVGVFDQGEEWVERMIGN